MINRAVITSRLTRDPELKTTQSGLSVATFTLAVNRLYSKVKNKSIADFISCVIWRKAAENFCNFTKKGSLVGVDGRIQTRSYENKDGQRVYVTEVVVDNFALLEAKPEQQNNVNTSDLKKEDRNSAETNQDIKKEPFEGNGETIEISDDDLPF